MPVFLHPPYGLGNEHYAKTSHSLFVALGFPFETTMAVSRLILSGAFDRHPNLKFLLAHAGGTLPFLSGRLDSCVEHEREHEHEHEHKLRDNTSLSKTDNTLTCTVYHITVYTPIKHPALHIAWLT